jgi:hypothetical protein
MQTSHFGRFWEPVKYGFPTSQDLVPEQEVPEKHAALKSSGIKDGTVFQLARLARAELRPRSATTTMEVPAVYIGA